MKAGEGKGQFLQAVPQKCSSLRRGDTPGSWCCTTAGLSAVLWGSWHHHGALCTAVGLCTAWVSRRRRMEAA